MLSKSGMEFFLVLDSEFEIDFTFYWSSEYGIWNTGSNLFLLFGVRIVVHFAFGVRYGILFAFGFPFIA